MALALGALVAGFFISTSTLPLIASIALSSGVMLLILFGWSRRIRKGLDLYDGTDDELAVDEVTFTEVDEETFRPPAESGRRTSSVATASRTAVRPGSAEETTIVKRKAPGAKPKPVAKKAPAKKRPAAKKKPAARKSGTTSTTRVLVIPGRSRYHRPGCRFAKGDELREVSEATAKRRGYESCNVCGP
jgi:hypothetical protein